MRGQNGWGQGGCRYVTLFSTPTCMSKRTLCPRVTDGSVLATACGKLPILSSITLCTEDSWEADIPSSQFSVENKRVWDPSYTHVHVCMWPPPPPTKKLSIQLQADHISARLAYRQQSYETFVEGESLTESEKQRLTPPQKKWVGILKYG